MNPLLPSINAFADSWVNAMIRASWQGGVFIIAVWILCRALPKIPARVQCWLWRLVYLKLIFVLCSPASIDLPLLPARMFPPSAAAATPAGMVSPSSSLIVNQANAGSAPAPYLPNVSTWFLFVWAIGLGACGLRIFQEWRRLRLLKRECRPLDESRLSRCGNELYQYLGLFRLPRVVVADSISRPLLLGMMRPVVVLSESLIASSSREQLRLMLAHEFAHIKRFDLWWVWLSVTAESLFFFHPLVWLAKRESRLAQEIACDEIALRVTAALPLDYGNMLLEVLIQSGTPSSGPQLISANIVETKQTLERRIKAMKFIGTTSRKSMLTVTVLVLFTGILGLMPWRVVAEKERPEQMADALRDELHTQFELTPAEVNLAQSEVKRMEKLLRAGFVTEGELAKIKADTSRTQARLAEAKTALSYGGFNEDKESAQSEKKRADELQKALQELLSLRERFTDAHPAVQAQQRYVEELRRDAASRNEPKRDVVISSGRPGLVKRILVKSGGQVKAGDLLLQLDDREARVKLEVARAQLDAAKASLRIYEAEVDSASRELEQKRKLAAQKVLSQEELTRSEGAYEAARARMEKARAEVKVAEAYLKQAEMELDVLNIRSPREGIIRGLDIKEGEYVTPKQPLHLISIQP